MHQKNIKEHVWAGGIELVSLQEWKKQEALCQIQRLNNPIIDTAEMLAE